MSEDVLDKLTEADMIDHLCQSFTQENQHVGNLFLTKPEGLYPRPFLKIMYFLQRIDGNISSKNKEWMNERKTKRKRGKWGGEAKKTQNIEKEADRKTNKEQKEKGRKVRKRFCS